MWTTTSLDRPSGLLVAQTRTQSVTQLGGFHGCVLVSLLDNRGYIIRSSDPHTYGVDRRLIGTSDRSDVWTHQFDPAEANAAVSLGIVHTWDPQGLIGALLEIGKMFPFPRVPDGYLSTDTGTDDPTSWSEDGEPWASTEEALTAARTRPAGWQDIGHANSVKSMTTALGKIFAVTTDNQVWSRDPVFNEVNWDLLGFCADLKQVWFPGVHCDVGGGYRETGLSNGALKWMIDEAVRVGLRCIFSQASLKPYGKRSPRIRMPISKEPSGTIDLEGERVPWFCLVGAIANGGTANADGEPEPHETNRGSVVLKVSC